MKLILLPRKANNQVYDEDGYPMVEIIDQFGYPSALAHVDTFSADKDIYNLLTAGFRVVVELNIVKENLS